ncbi:MAG: hypothetical protein VYD71_02460 [Bacteroidota bacterium]|nr:hypothetical protein [Bacteroidota bacterium]
MRKEKNKLNSTKRRFYFFFVRQSLAIKNLFFAKKQNTYLFILTPLFSGSTLLNQILSTSENIICNNNIRLREVQHLPKTNEIMLINSIFENEKNVLDYFSCQFVKI